MIWLRLGIPVAAFVVAAIVWLPMRMAWAAAPAQPGFSVERIEGTVWDGKVVGVAWRGLALGEFRAALSPLSLLPAPTMSFSEGTGPVSAAKVHMSASATQLSDVELSVPLSQLFPMITDAGDVRISGGEIILNNGACSEASGSVSTSAAPSLGVPAFEGRIACDGGALTVALASRDKLHKVLLELTGSTFSKVSVREASPEASLVLAGLGIGRVEPAAEAQ